MRDKRLPDDVLRHWGILGQKWGVRRYQNYDGTLTAAGKARYGQSNSSQGQTQSQAQSQSRSATASSTQTQNTSDPQEANRTNYRVRNPAYQSDEELKASIQRMQNEKMYRQLYNDLNPQTVDAGQEFTNNVKKELLNATVKTIGSVAQTQMTYRLNKALGYVPNEKQDNNKKKDK